MELLRWLEDATFLHWVRVSEWGYHFFLVAHALGMAIVVGVGLMFSARLLGYSREYRLAGFDPLLRLAWLGFMLNAASGAILFFAQGRRMIVTPAFQIKMVLLVLAVASLWYLMKEMKIRGEVTPEHGTIPRRMRIAAIFPIVLWIGAIVAGRLIGYTVGPPPS